MAKRLPRLEGRSAYDGTLPREQAAQRMCALRPGQGCVPMGMQIVSKLKPRAACEPLLNTQEESFPDELAGLFRVFSFLL